MTSLNIAANIDIAANANPGAITHNSATKLNHDWFAIKPREDKWLVDGLITTDGHTYVVGKPKAGKSSAVRSLVASVIKSSKFLGRAVKLPEGTGKVLYIHLDRKDVPWRVAQELRDTLGVTQQEAHRLHLRFADDLPKGYDNRLLWLQEQAEQIQPHLIVIDLMWQFAAVKNGNDYQAVLECINALQDALIAIEYKGALVVTLHARKATNLADEGDDALGSSAQRGSFTTGIHLCRDRNAGHYTIMSDQTIRDDVWGEIDKSILIRNPDGSLSLGQRVSDLLKKEKHDRNEEDIQRILSFVANNQGCDITQIMDQLGMSKKRVLFLMNKASGLFTTEGKGVKGDPLKYFVPVLEESDPVPGAQAEADAFLSKFLNVSVQ